MSEALRISIVGAGRAGDDAFAQALAARIETETGLDCGWAADPLQDWCERHQRRPQRDELQALVRAQIEAVDEAAAGRDLVVAASAPLLSAAYGRLAGGDAILEDSALEFQRRCAISLLGAVNENGRDARQRHDALQVDTLLRAMLNSAALPWLLIAGDGQARLDSALDALAPLLRGRSLPRRGLFTRLAARNAEDKPWRCDLCDDPGCEHRLRSG